MPRISLRRKAIEAVAENVQTLRLRSHLRRILDEEDEVKDLWLLQQISTLKKMIGSRYLFRSKKNRKKRAKFNLEDILSYDSENLNAEEFLHTFRMTRDSFFLFLERTITMCKVLILGYPF